jgi:hypothetical protein
MKLSKLRIIFFNGFQLVLLSSSWESPTASGREALLNQLLLFDPGLNKCISTSLRQAQGRLLNVTEYKRFVP